MGHQQNHVFQYQDGLYNDLDDLGYLFSRKPPQLIQFSSVPSLFECFPPYMFPCFLYMFP